MTRAAPEPTITLGQLVRLLDVVDVNKLRTAKGDIDTAAVAHLVEGLTQASGSASARRITTAGSGRQMFNERHRKAGPGAKGLQT